MSKELLDKYTWMAEQNAFAKHTNITITDIELSGASACCDLTPELMNVYGYAHGGVYFTLADTCAGFSARADGRRYVTRQANTYYVSAANSGRIYAKGTVKQRSRKFCLVDVEVTDESGKLLTHGSFDYYCLDD